MRPDKITVLIICLGIIIALNTTQIVLNKMRIDEFMHKGKRFTAKDGQELCERVRKLEYYRSGYSADCDYLNDNH